MLAHAHGNVWNGSEFGRAFGVAHTTVGRYLDLRSAAFVECYFWGTYAGAELDLLVVRGSLRLGFEFKRTVAPVVTQSMRVAGYPGGQLKGGAVGWT